MSIDASTIQLLLDGNMGGQEILFVAKAMARGDNRDYIYSLIDGLEDVGCARSGIALAVVKIAAKLIEEPEPRKTVRDGYSKSRDSNKSRRGLSNEQWTELRAEVYARDGERCQYCGDTDDLTCDHIVPLVRGGTNELENLTIACRRCNSSKGHKLLSEWRGRAQ